MSEQFPDLDAEAAPPSHLRLEGPPIQAVRPPSQPYHHYDDVTGVDDIHILDYVKILYKRRWSALTAFSLVFVSVVVYTFTATRVYEATTQVLIEKEDSNVVSFKEAIEQNQLTDDYYQTQYKILQSRALARRTIDGLGLWEHPHFNPAPDNSLSVGKVVNAPVNWVLSFLEKPKAIEPASAAETSRQSSILDRFLGGLTVAPVRSSRLVDVRFESTDPIFATQIANGLARAYIEQNLEFQYTSSKEATDWLGERLAEQRKKVDASEQALQRYRERTDAVPQEDSQNIVVQKLTDLNAAVTRAKTDRMQKEGAHAQIRALQKDRAALETHPAILSNGFIQQQKTLLADLQRQQAQLSDKLGARHPEMVKVTLAMEAAEARIQGETAKVVESRRNDFQQAQAQEQALVNALDVQKREALSLNRKGIEYGVLARDAASNRQIFESLMQRTRETGIAGELRSSNIRVVDQAEVPRSPARPNPRNNLLFAFFGGLTLALGLAFAFEYLDNRIKSPDDVGRHLGLAFLGMVPALFDKSILKPLVSHGVPAQFFESFRAARSNLIFSSAEEGCRSIVVTSTGPGEGKTVVAANLAEVLAQAGQRVLLIDGDMRKPRVHELFGRNQEPGLSNVLVGKAKASESVLKTALPGLWIMPAGVYPPNPAELLGSKRFKDFLGSLTQHFDWVIIDSPPVMAVTDSSVIAHLTNGVVFVIGSEMTSRHAARRAIEQIHNARGRIVGAILNRVDIQHNPYYYSQYYRPEYSDYYQKNARTQAGA